MAGKKPDQRGELNDMQKRFVDEFLVDFNATQAAIRAGYSEKTARSQATDLLAKPDIGAEIARKQEARAKRLDVTVDRIELELARIAFSDMAKYVRWGPEGVIIIDSAEMTEDETRAVLEVSEKVVTGDFSSSRHVKFKLHDKVKALELLSKRHGWEEGGANGAKVNWLQVIINAQTKQ